MRRTIFAALAACALLSPARAQDHFFPTPGNAEVGGVVQMCLNSSGNAVPVSSGTCAGGGTQVTGTFWPYSLGQQLAAGSVPVVLTAAQIATLTPPTTVTVNPGTSPWVTTQTSIGTTYNTVAASQSAQIMSAISGGTTGALGDYLSHCTVIPTSTSPGVVTILDNATTIYAFPGGASSLSNLSPFTIPVGAKSVSGAWKITTGANLSAVCVGKFT